MGAICPVCKRDMLKSDGCEYTHIHHKGKLIPRSLEHWQEPGERCHDCGALYGQPHHKGCDVERCPICGNQFIGCDCFGESIEYVTIVEPKKKAQ